MKNALLAPGFGAALSLVAVVGVQANDWPQWRGPNRDAVSTEKGLLQDWPTSGPLLVWKATGLGLGYSTVSVAQGHVFVVGDKGQESFALALKVDDSKKFGQRSSARPVRLVGAGLLVRAEHRPWMAIWFL